MLRKLTINVNEDVYEALHKVVGQGNISQFIERLVRPHVTRSRSMTAAQGRGIARYKGPHKTDADIREGLEAGIRRRWAEKNK